KAITWLASPLLLRISSAFGFSALFLLALKNYLCQRLRFCMRNTQRNSLHTKPFCDFPSLAGESHRRPPAPLSDNFQVQPPHAAAPSCPQRLHRRFFCRESSRVSFEFVFESLAIFNLCRREHPPQECLPATRYRRPHALHFRNVH